jgi:uncharacterized membrane protein YagU involved in acid resistance
MLRGAVAFTYRNSEDEFWFAGKGVEVTFFCKHELFSLLQEILTEVFADFFSGLQLKHVCCLSLHIAKAFSYNLVMMSLSAGHFLRQQHNLH